MIVGFHSFKGGSGKTFVTLNLGYLLSKRGKKVCIIEMDMRAPSLHTFFEFKRFVNELISSKKPVREYLVSVRENLSVIAASPEIRDIRREILREDVESLKMLRRLQEVLSELKAMGFEYVLIDNPPGLSYISINSMLVSDVIFFVVRAEQDDLIGLKILFDVSKNVEKPKYVILNRVTEDVDVKDFPVFGRIPCSCEVSTNLPFFVEKFEQHEVSAAIEEIAEKISAKT